ncbi:MAG: DUF1801 domain-containing protein [Cyclobacteriaceae bacterium]
MQDVEEFIENLPRDEQVIFKRLRGLIFQAEPQITEKLNYGVPYYSRHKRLFFLWPASAVPCGYKHNTPPPKVTLGFCYGNLLSNAQRLLMSEGRKQVYTINISSLANVNERLLSEILFEAILVDEQLYKKKMKHL